jgi:hypothetical protein
MALGRPSSGAVSIVDGAPALPGGYDDLFSLIRYEEPGNPATTKI